MQASHSNKFWWSER